MSKLLGGRSFRFAWRALSAVILVAAGCTGSASPFMGSGGASSGPGMGNSGNTGGESTNGDAGGDASTPTGGPASESSNGATASGSGGNGAPASASNVSGSGATTSASSGSGATADAASSGSGATTSASGGSGATADASVTGTSTEGGAPTLTPDLIGPGGATCGATNATHGDGWMCILSYPSPGTNAVGAWFDYSWAGTTCNLSFGKPSGNNASNPQICFSSTGCTGAAPGAGLGLNICDIHGVDVSTWPQMQQLISSHGLSTTGKSAFSSCNTGAKMTALEWTVGSGSIPAGTTVMFDDASDQVLGRVDGLVAGATSVTVPATADTTKIASIQFSFNAAKITSWNFCLSSFKIAYQ